MDKVQVLDTTLRDGEQAPGCSMNLREKLEVARCLEQLRVDVVEAGFAVASPDDAEAIAQIARMVKTSRVASLARARRGDIDAAWDAVRGAEAPRLHIFLATSALHLEHKLHMTPDEVVEAARESVAHARTLCPDVEFSAEDATRSDPAFLVRVLQAAADAGATCLNVPDTVGYATPDEMRALVELVREQVDAPAGTVFSVHCHNDLGLATANALAGVAGGARQIECTLCGLGERAGNTALEEAVMALRVRAGALPFETGIDTTHIHHAAQTVYRIIGQRPPLNKAVVGRNAFSHEAGIHQQGVMANRATYEIMSPADLGVPADNLVLGKHSGKHALEERLDDLGFSLLPHELADLFEEFKDLCDKKKTVTDADLAALATKHSVNVDLASEHGWKLDWFSAHTSNFTTATCTVSLFRNGERFEEVALGDGPIDAALNAIDKIAQPTEHTFDIYNIHSISEGKDTLGEANIKLASGGRTYTGRGLSTDVIEASIKAYLMALNLLEAATRASG